MSDNLERARQLFTDALARHVERDWAAAEPLYRAALELAPDRPSIVFNLGRLMLDQENHAAAEALFRQSVALAPDHENHYNLALCLAKQGRAAEAVAQYDQAIALEPKFAQACAGRAAALEQLGQVAQALENYARSVELAPEVAGYQVAFAHCARQLGRTADLPVPALIETAALICLMATHVQYQDLHGVVVALLARRFAAFRREVAAANFDWPKIASSNLPGLQAFCNDWLLVAVLEKIVLDGAADDGFLIRLRASLLKLAVIGPKSERLAILLEPVSLFLAQQCALHHHAWPVGEGETALLAKLQTRVAGALASSIPDGMDIGVLACYQRLADIPGFAGRATVDLATASPALQRLIRAQLPPG